MISLIGLFLISGDLVASDSSISLLDEGKSVTAKLWKSDKGLFALTNDENVAETGSKGVSHNILNVDNLVGTWMVLNGHENTCTSNIVTALDENHGAVLEFDNSINLTSGKVQLDGIVLLDVWVRVADGSAVVGHNVRNFVFSKLLLGDFAKLKASFSGINSDWLETTLDVVEHAEVLVGLWDSEHIHKSEWVLWVSSGSVVNFEIASSNSAHLERLLAGESVLESVAEQHRQWDALSKLVWSR